MNRKKHIVFILFFIGFFSWKNTIAQNKKIPTNLMVKKIDKNEWVDLQSQLNTEGATIISFWATWCKPCIMELNTINEEYAQWKEDTKVKLIAISIDDSRSSDRAKAFVKANNWEYEVFLDLNGDLNREMGINSIIPYTFILDKNGNIVYTHTSYMAGDEAEYLDIITKIAHNEVIKP